MWYNMWISELQVMAVRDNHLEEWMKVFPDVERVGDGGEHVIRVLGGCYILRKLRWGTCY